MRRGHVRLHDDTKGGGGGGAHLDDPALGEPAAQSNVQGERPARHSLPVTPKVACLNDQERPPC